MQAVNPQLLPEGIKKCWRMKRILLELLQAEEARRRLCSIRYRLSQAKFPMGKDLDSFDFKGSPVNEEQIRHLYQGSFVSDGRNLVFIGGTGTGTRPTWPSPSPDR